MRRINLLKEKQKDIYLELNNIMIQLLSENHNYEYHYTHEIYICIHELGLVKMQRLYVGIIGEDKVLCIIANDELIPIFDININDLFLLTEYLKIKRKIN